LRASPAQGWLSQSTPIPLADPASKSSISRSQVGGGGKVLQVHQ
jgi:hypothetical protein